MAPGEQASVRWGRDAAIVVAAVLLALAALEGFARLLDPGVPSPARGRQPEVPKPPDVFRVFMFGASSVRGGAVPELGYVSQLEFWLRRGVPDRRIEIYNYGVRGAVTEVLLASVRRVIDREPDLAFLHTGMGEFFLPDSEMRSRARLIEASQRSALVRVVRRIAAGSRQSGAAARIVESGDIPLYDPGSEAYRRKLDRYRANVTAIVDVIRGAGVPLLLSTVSSNLADWPPVNRSLSALLYDDGFDDTLDEIEGHLDAQRPAPAIEMIERSLERYPDDALLLFLLGKAHQRSGDYARARELFYRARDRDPLPWRPVSESNDFIREIATRDGVHLIDLERVLEENAPHGLVGATLIGDGAHPTPLGSSIIARAILRQMAALGFAISPDAGVFSVRDPLGAYLRRLPRRPRLQTRYLHETALFCLKYPLRHTRVARMHLDQLLALQPSDWRAWANLATVSFFERRTEQGIAELREAMAIKGDAEGLLEPVAAPYLEVAMSHAGVSFDAVKSTATLR
jgi:tetratricopeptide (TPR) repeat protein